MLVGGLRARLVRESLFRLLFDALGDLGWFDPGRGHADIRFVSEGFEQDEEIPLNTLVLVDEDIISFDAELGSRFAEHRWTFFVDFFAENEAVGVDLIRDVREILRGGFSAVSGGPTFTVYDWREATPTELFTVDVEDVSVDKAHGFTKAWQRHWYSCSFQVVDNYSTDI